MSNKYTGFPTVLKRGNADGPPETFTSIAGVRAVSPPKGTANVVDSTTMDNPNGFKTKLSGLRDGGTAKLQVAFDPADTGHQTLIIDYKLGTLRDFEVVLPDTGQTVVAFSAIVKECGPETPLDGLMTMDCSLEVSGEPKWGTFA